MNKHKRIIANQELDVTVNAPIRTSEVFARCITQNCKGWPIITDNVSGEILCGSCGRVLEERSLETVSSHWLDPTDYLTKKNSGAANSLAMFDMNMSTVMSKRDSTGKSLSRTVKNDFYRLNILNTRSTVASKSKTLRSALLFLNMLQMKLGIPDSIVENAAHMYRKAVRAKMTIGRKSKNIMCACIYASCKQCGIPRSILEIAIVSNIGKKEIARTYRSLVDRLDLSINPFSSREFLSRIANEAKISEKSRRDAIEIIYVMEKAGITQGKNPKGLASASLYLACVLNAEKITQAEIAKASGITSTTIRTRYYDLKKFYLETIDLQQD